MRQRQTQPAPRRSHRHASSSSSWCHSPRLPLPAASVSPSLSAVFLLYALQACCSSLPTAFAQSSSGSDSNTPSISLSAAFLRIVASLGFGCLIGLERELTNFQRRLRGMAGIRTHALICCGSCLIQLISVFGYGDDTNRDPARLAAQAVSGIGFVGAGAIIKGSASTLYGLTSAASIWLVMAVGLAVGLGMWLIVLLTVCAALLLMVGTKHLERRVFGRQYGPGCEAELEVVARDEAGVLQRISRTVAARLGVAAMSIDKTAASQQPQQAEEKPPPSASQRIKFRVSLADIDLDAFRLRLQCTVLLLGEDDEVVKVESSAVRESAAAVPSHRMEWSRKDAAELQRDEQEQRDWEEQVRLTRRRRTEQRQRGGGAGGQEGREAAGGGSEGVRGQEAAAAAAVQLDIAAAKQRIEC